MRKVFIILLLSFCLSGCAVGENDTVDSIGISAEPITFERISDGQQSEAINVIECEGTMSEDGILAIYGEYRNCGILIDEIASYNGKKYTKELENGIEVYNIEFSYENKEYDYKINSANGEIVEYDYDIEDYDITQQQATKENKSVTPNNQNSNNSKITVEKAKEISLKHANLKDNQVVFDKTEMDYDNGVQVYDIEFHYNNIEYNYEIDANTGNILSYSQD